MTRLLIVPAAGLGSRFAAGLPKLLAPVNGRAMIDHVLELYAPFVDRSVLVVHPSFEEQVRRHCANLRGGVDYAIQPRPTGMLDAILLPAEIARRHAPKDVWITWCDQVAIHPGTVARLAERARAEDGAAMVLPTCRRQNPYIHLVRDGKDRLVAVQHRREGDVLPAVGENDAGLFHLSRAAYLDDLAEYAAHAEIGAVSGERNFLPFIPWLARRAAVETFPCVEEIESVGINTVADLEQVERHLRWRGACLESSR